MDRRDFLGGIACLLPVFANKAVPVIGNVIDPTKPVVIESPQLLKPGHHEKGACIELGCLSDLRIGHSDTHSTTFRQVLITNIEAQEEFDEREYMDMRGQHFKIPVKQAWRFNIQGISSPDFVCVEEPGKSKEIAVYRKAR